MGSSVAGPSSHLRVREQFGCNVRCGSPGGPAAQDASVPNGFNTQRSPDSRDAGILEVHLRGLLVSHVCSA